MKKVQTLLLLVLTFSIYSCKSNNQEDKINETIAKEVAKADLTLNEGEGKTGTFSTENSNFNGKTSTQFLGDKTKDQFSVVCQQDEPFTMLQITFANKAAATGNLKPAEGFYSMEPGEAHISLSGSSIGNSEFVTNDNSSGSITVKGSDIILKDLKLFNNDGASKVVNANIQF